MPPKKEIYTKIKDLEHFQTFFNENNHKLSGKLPITCRFLVIDVYVNWAGACTDLMYPTYKNLSNNIDDWEKRIEFLEVINLSLNSAIGGL
jgi:hypothetical protein